MKLVAQKRAILGKKVKTLRQQEKLPGAVFGKETGSIPITLAREEFEKVFAEVGESTLVDVEIEGQKPLKVLISGVDVDPVSREILHANLQAVSLKDKISTQVPVEIVGEPPIVKSGQGILLTLLDEIEIACLPQDLPSEIKVDVSQLTKIGQSVTVGDLSLDRQKIEIKNKPKDLVVKIDHPEMEEEKEEEETVSIEEAVEITTKRKKEEEETTATEQS